MAVLGFSLLVHPDAPLFSSHKTKMSMIRSALRCSAFCMLTSIMVISILSQEHRSHRNREGMARCSSEDVIFWQFHHGGISLMNRISVTSTIQHWYCGNRLESAKTLFQVFCVNQCSFGGKKSLRDLKTCKCLALSKYLVTGLHLHI